MNVLKMMLSVIMKKKPRIENNSSEKVRKNPHRSERKLKEKDDEVRKKVKVRMSYN